MANAANEQTQRICTALQWDLSDPAVEIEVLVTLPHSLVARVRNADRNPMIFKQAGSADFAAGVRKELIVNRDVLSQLPSAVGPAFVNGNETSELPWMLFEDVATRYTEATAAPPRRETIELFVDSLARTHAQAHALPLADLFKNVEGDVRVSDGAEYIPAVLDEFLHRTDSSQFPPRSYELIRRIRDNVPRIAQLLIGDDTLVHGDAHFRNALYTPDNALLIDWALAVIGPGEVDLAHALAMNLPRLHSSEYEPALFARYVDTCSRHGHSTSEAKLLENYRKCLLVASIVAVGMNTVPGITNQVWTFLFTNTMHSALDHDVMELIG